jgi:hypothetical protein
MDFCDYQPDFNDYTGSSEPASPEEVKLTWDGKTAYTCYEEFLCASS